MSSPLLTRLAGQKKLFTPVPKGPLQRAATSLSPVHEVPPALRDVLRSPGHPLDAAMRAAMEPRFKHDFSRVRVHSDEHAGRSAHALGLEAFTLGNHVYLGRAAEGSALLPHELGHVSRGEGRAGTIEGWSSSGHRTITGDALAKDSRYSGYAKTLLANTSAVLDYNRPQILQDMVSYWAGEKLYRAPLGMIAGAIIGGITPPEQGTQVGGARVSGVLPQALLGMGLIPTVPAEERRRGPEGKERSELAGTRIIQELANHGEDRPERNEARMNEYADQGSAIANGGDLYNGLVQLGYGLHAAQDRGSHGDGYTADYVQNRPHSEIDNMAANPEGVAAAVAHSQEILNRFFDALTAGKRRDLADPLLLGVTRPPVAETILAPPQATGPSPLPGTEAGPQPGGLNILTIRF